MFSLSPSPIDSITLKKKIQSDYAGAVCSFDGIVRNYNEGKKVNFLEYQAHPSLCNKEAQKILTEAVEKFDITKAVCTHRIGTLQIGDSAVWIGVSAAHRDHAFRACRYIIDEIKNRLPIWKKEHYLNETSDWIDCTSKSSLEFDEQTYYSRQTILSDIKEDGQEKLRKAKVLVVGAGGLGSTALQNLAGSGIGTIGICEFDQVDISNLHRQPLYTVEDINLKKIDVAAERISSLNPSLQINKHDKEITYSNVEKIISEYEIILDCTDNFKTKFLLNDACVLKNKILIQASVYQWEGQLRTYIPKQTACLRCLWSSIPKPNTTGTCSEVGVINSAPGVLGQLQALETLKCILKLPSAFSAQTILFNFKEYGIKKIKDPINTSCVICSQQPQITSIQKENYMTENKTSLSLQDIKIDDLDKYTFVDVRESVEIMMSPVKEIETLHVPLSGLDEDNLPFNKENQYIIFCAAGIRSLNLTQYLRDNGFENVLSLIEGADSFSSYLQKNLNQ